VIGFRAADAEAASWIERLGAKHGLPSDLRTGLPLCRLRLTSDEYAELRTLLSRYLQLGWAAPRRMAALFCLFATETIRRREAGGAWSWDMVVVALGTPQNMSRGDLADLTERGLAYFGRPLRRGADGDRRFLHSLLFEAGLPATLLASASFADFLRQAQRDIDIASTSTPEGVLALTERQAYRLVPSWRRPETVSLAAELLHALQPVRATRLAGGNPDLAHPGWRDLLPLDLSEATAERVVSMLLQLARPAARPHRELHALCQRILLRRDAGWEERVAPPEAGLLPPSATTAPLFSGSDHPHRVRLSVAGVELALIEFEARDRWLLRPISRASTLLPFDQPVEARLIVDGQERAAVRLAGGDPLDAPPWVLEELGSPDCLIVVGQGSRTTSADRLYLAVPEGGTLEVRHGDATPVGALEAGAGLIYAVTGEAVWRGAGESLAIRLRTGSATAEAPRIEFSMASPRWQVPGSVASLGPPKVSVLNRPKGGRLVWRLRRGGEWRDYAHPLPLGDLEIALVREGELLDRRRLLVLPPDANIAARPAKSGAEVRISGMPDAEAFLPDYPDAELRKDSGGLSLVASFAGLPPAEITLAISSAGNAPTRHRIRLPAPGGGFLDRERRLIAGVAAASFVDLPRMAARGGSAENVAEITARLVATDGPLAGIRLARTLGFVEELPLARLIPELRRLYATAGERDAEIQLRASQGGVLGSALRAAAFDYTVGLGDGGRVHLCDRRGQPTQIQGEMIAVSPVRPSADPVSLKSAGAGAWEVPEDAEAGPWMLLGAGHLAGRVRPRIRAGSAPAAPCEGLLAAAAATQGQASRDAAFDAVLARLAADPMGDGAAVEWAFLDATLDATEPRAPAIFFDVLARAADCPELLPHWLLRCDEIRLSRLLRLEDELPMAWALVPLSAWRNAALSFTEFYREFGADVTSLLSQRLADIAALCPPTQPGVWEAREVLGVAHRADQVGRAGLGPLGTMLAAFAGPDPGEGPWRAAVASCVDWENLPTEVHAGAPHAAARRALGLSSLSLREVAAVRFCRHAAPDDFDHRFLYAVLSRIALGVR
jgi:hypothetical protein